MLAFTCLCCLNSNRMYNIGPSKLTNMTDKNLSKDTYNITTIISPNYDFQATTWLDKIAQLSKSKERTQDASCY